MANQTTGTLITASEWNKIGDNFRVDAVGVVTTAGDLAYATGANAMARLGIGLVDKPLTSTGSAIQWGSNYIPKVTRKTADESVTSSTTFQDDDVLLQAILASQVWLCKWYVFCSVNAAGGIKFAVTVPTSASLVAGGHTWNAGSANSSTASTTTSGGSIMGATTSIWYAEVTAYVANSTNAGNVTLQWAQNASNAAASTVQIGSTLVATRIA